MLEDFQKVLNPKSLLEIVPGEILTAMMQGFFFGHRAGMVLIYDEGSDPDGNLILKRLEPVSQEESERNKWRDVSENFNPFCACFRQDPDHDRMCNQCDLQRAKAVFDERNDGNIRYFCHMGLIDMTIAIRVDGKVRGVVYGGQKVLDVADRLQASRRLVQNKAPESAEALLQLLEDTKIPESEVKRFEESFTRFVSGLQSTVDAFHRRRQNEAERQALLKVGDHIGRSFTDDPGTWFDAAQRLIEELHGLCRRRVWMFTRRFSKFECTASYPPDTQADDTKIPVGEIITELEEDKIVSTLSGANLHRVIATRLNVSTAQLTLVRSDSRVGVTDVASVVLIVAGTLEPRFSELFLGCARALSYPAGVHLLFRRMEKQQQDFARTAAFSGHHFKTPVQIAQWDLEEAIESLTDESEDELLALLSGAYGQMTQALADANRMMAIKQDFERTRFSPVKLIEDLASDFKSVAARRNIVIRIVEKPSQALCVYGIEFQFRVALTNLLENAIKYSYENHTIDVGIKVLRNVRRTRSFVQIVVQNFGVGFPLEMQDTLFEVGVRSDTKVDARQRIGQGIGLPQAKEYIEAAGGSLSISSVLLPSKSAHSGGIYCVQVVCLIPLV